MNRNHKKCINNKSLICQKFLCVVLAILLAFMMVPSQLAFANNKATSDEENAQAVENPELDGDTTVDKKTQNGKEGQIDKEAAIDGDCQYKVDIATEDEQGNLKDVRDIVSESSESATESDESDDSNKIFVNISGRVTDKDTGEPLEGIQVYYGSFQRPGYLWFNYTVTDSNGEYCLYNNLGNSISGILMRGDGYSTSGDIVSIFDHDMTSIDFQLDKGYVLDYSSTDPAWSGLHRYNVTFEWFEFPVDPWFLSLFLHICRYGTLVTDGEKLEYEYDPVKPENDRFDRRVVVRVWPIAIEGYEITKNSWTINGKHMEIGKKYVAGECGVDYGETIKIDYKFHKKSEDKHTVYGYVTDSASGLPISDATVYCENQEGKTTTYTTDDNGYYEFEAKDGESVTVSAVAEDYVFNFKELKNIKDDVELNFEMEEGAKITFDVNDKYAEGFDGYKIHLKINDKDIIGPETVKDIKPIYLPYGTKFKTNDDSYFSFDYHKENANCENSNGIESLQLTVVPLAKENYTGWFWKCGDDNLVDYTQEYVISEDFEPFENYDFNITYIGVSQVEIYGLDGHNNFVYSATLNDKEIKSSTLESLKDDCLAGSVASVHDGTLVLTLDKSADGYNRISKLSPCAKDGFVFDYWKIDGKVIDEKSSFDIEQGKSIKFEAVYKALKPDEKVEPSSDSTNKISSKSEHSASTGDSMQYILFASLIMIILSSLYFVFRYKKSDYASRI